VRAVKIVKLALGVDCFLGARLAGEVQPKFQETTIEFVKALDLPDWLKVQCLRAMRSENVILSLSKLIKDFESYVRSRAADELGKIETEAETAIPALLKLLEHHNSDVRESAADELGKIGTEAAIPALFKLLEHPDSTVCSRAADELGKIKTEAAILALFKLLEHPDSTVCSRAADELGEIGTEAAILALLKLAAESFDFNMRKRAAEALGKIGETAIPALLKLLENSQQHRRKAIVRALSHLPNEQIVTPLLRCIQCCGISTREEVAKAFGRFGNSPNLSKLSQAQILQALSNTLESTYFSLRRLSVEAIVQIGNPHVLVLLHKKLLSAQYAEILLGRICKL
jgi:HEAT repeat protein